MIMMGHGSKLAKKKLEDKKIANDGKNGMGSVVQGRQGIVRDI